MKTVIARKVSAHDESPPKKSRVLPRHERETVISWTQGDETFSMFTYLPRLTKHLRERGLKPVMRNGYGGEEFEVPMSWYRLPYPPRQIKSRTKT